MPAARKQILNVQKHEKLKLFFISVCDDTPKNRLRISVKINYGKVQAAFKKFEAKKLGRKANDAAEHAADASFFGALLATKLEDWTDTWVGGHTNPFLYDFDAAYEAKEKLIDMLESEGWKHCASRGHIKAKFITGKYGNQRWGKWSPKSILANKTMEQFFAVCDKFLITLDDEDRKEELKNMAYFEAFTPPYIVKNGAKVRRESTIKTKGDLVMFLVENEPDLIGDK